jgi:hypothetical protein
MRYSQLFGHNVAYLLGNINCMHLRRQSVLIVDGEVVNFTVLSFAVTFEPFL